MASMPIAVLMQRRSVGHVWADDAWEALGVVPDSGRLPPVQMLSRTAEREQYLVSGLELELYPDENDGYFENVTAPQAKVFVLWRMQEGRAMPVRASVSYVEGTRMFDSGEHADGVTMPAEIRAWVAAYLSEHYRPPARRGRLHG